MTNKFVLRLERILIFISILVVLFLTICLKKQKALGVDFFFLSVYLYVCFLNLLVTESLEFFFLNPNI